MEEKVDKQVYEQVVKERDLAMVKFWAISKALDAERRTSDELRIRLEVIERELYEINEEKRRQRIEEAQECSRIMQEMGRSVMARERDVDMPPVELVPGPSNEFERLSVLVGRLQAVLASEGELSVTVWDSDHSTWCDQPGLYLEVVDNTDGMGGLVHEGIEHSRFLGIR